MIRGSGSCGYFRYLDNEKEMRHISIKKGDRLWLPCGAFYMLSSGSEMVIEELSKGTDWSTDPEDWFDRL